MSNPKHVRKRGAKIAAILMGLTITAGILEGGARVFYHYYSDILRRPILGSLGERRLILDPYEVTAPEHGFHWRLQPGYRASHAQVMGEKAKAGRDVGVAALSALPSGTGELRINKLGFKGPEIDAEHRSIRILMLGDSATFGSGEFDYVRFAGARLNAGCYNFEVINGGVEGYSALSHLLELDRYLDLKPEIVTIYIGWNSLFTIPPSAIGDGYTLRITWLVERARHAWDMLRGKGQERAMILYNRALNPDPNAAVLRTLEREPDSSLADAEILVTRLVEAGIGPILVTLPGLFVADEAPSEEALAKGHLPPYTDNPYVLAKVAEQYNAAVRGFARKRGIPVIDLARWSRKAFVPRDAYFSDSVHLTSVGMKAVGAYMAEEIHRIAAQNRDFGARVGGC